MKLTVRVGRKIKGGYKRATNHYEGPLGSGGGEGSQENNPNNNMFVVVLCGLLLIGLLIGVFLALVFR